MEQNIFLKKRCVEAGTCHREEAVLKGCVTNVGFLMVFLIGQSEFHLRKQEPKQPEYIKIDKYE